MQGTFSRTVPGVSFSRTGNEGNPNVTIRGIGGNGATVGAPTTGVYLDDTPLQRRNANGLITGNGSPFPQLFDLERGEVLRGPQGTLYGGSSQGGTIRFITPTPSLTRYSGQARAEVSSIKDGGENYEAGVAFGGPIVQDKLGAASRPSTRSAAAGSTPCPSMTATASARTSTGARRPPSAPAPLWQVTDRLRVTPAFYWSRDFDKNKSDLPLKTPRPTRRRRHLQQLRHGQRRPVRRSREHRPPAVHHQRHALVRPVHDRQRPLPVDHRRCVWRSSPRATILRCCRP